MHTQYTFIASFSGSSTPELLGLLLHHPDFEDFALYDNYQALRSFQESINVESVLKMSDQDQLFPSLQVYVNCSLIAPPTNYDYKPYAFGFQKVICKSRNMTGMSDEVL